MRLRRARYGDASTVEPTTGAVTASVQDTLVDDNSVERQREAPVDRSSTFQASDDSADDDAVKDLGVTDSDVVRLSSERSPLDFPDDEFVSLGV